MYYCQSEVGGDNFNPDEHVIKTLKIGLRRLDKRSPQSCLLDGEPRLPIQKKERKTLMRNLILDHA
jgi:hypothetical protein